MRLTAPLLALCLFLGACHHDDGYIADPLAPGAMGVIEIAPGVDTTAFTTLEVRGFMAAADTDDEGMLRLIPASPDVSSQSTLIDGVAFPFDFTVGAQGIGATDLPYYRVVAWLARAEGTTAPEDGAPWGTAVVALADCSCACEGTCYCGVATGNADVLLGP